LATATRSRSKGPTKPTKEVSITAEDLPGKTLSKTLKAVPVETLKRDTRWNRPIGKTRIENMGTNWSDVLAGVIVISERDNGDMILVDGQHRAAAARIAGKSELIAEVHTGLDEIQESKLFDELNMSRKTISAMDRFRARVFYKDPAAIAIKKMVEDRGGTIRESMDKGAVNNDIAAIATLERIYNTGGEDLLAWVLDIVTDSWEFLDSDTCSLMNLAGLLILWKRHNEKLDRDHLVEALNRDGYPAVRRMALAHRQLWGGTGVMNGYRAMVEVYNKSFTPKLRP
jgi:hypothetical protein